MSEAAIALAGVVHRYGKTVALDGVDLDVPAGCMAGLIGPDGVGKSTLLSLAAGVTRIQQGTVHVLGGDMAQRRWRRQAGGRIAYMPQGLGRNLYPTLSIAENLDFFGRLFGQGAAERRERIEELLAATGLAPFANRPAGKLSGGMKQKLGICAALIHDPDLVILDEPTTGIDPLSRRQFWELMARLRARRPSMSVIVATAYMEEAERFDWLAAMSGGRVLATGSPADILKQAGEPDLERAFVALLPQAERGAAEPLPDLPRVVHDGEPAIEATGLTRRFGDFVAVDHVDFRIEKGEIFGFLGSNGSGKSTTMKMLTGLLPASEGEAKLFGAKLEGRDMATRKRVGYMSQAFSLYAELTVRQNLVLHARLFELPDVEGRVAEMMERFDLAGVADVRPESLPLGIRQRLQLAVAVIHKPEILILDEPTSGVDPVARDGFWRTLIELSRKDGVTIFLSTHFMNEAERCDRISLMHAGKVLAIGAPEELQRQRGMASLEEVFIAVLEQAGMGREESAAEFKERPSAPAHVRRFDIGRLWAYARREALEIVRDPARLAFALGGPMLLLFTFGYGISFDVENLPYAAFDQDRSAQSRQLLESFEGSRYFETHAPVYSTEELDRRLRSGELKLAIEIPPDFGRDLTRERQPEVGVWLDGAMPFRAETTRGYVQGIAQSYLADEELRTTGKQTPLSPVSIEPRFRYNQAFKSVNAMVPNVIMLMLVLIPAIMTALGVVKEKETGSITNFQSTPVTRVEFLLGKQLPYVAIAFISFVTLVIFARFVFDVPVKGSLFALSVGSLAYVLATTGFGLLISSFVSSQVAAIFATAIISIVPAVNFSGLLVPVSSLSGGARLMGLAFPSSWYQQVSVGAFTKALGFAELWTDMVVIVLIGLVYIGLAMLALRKQGR
ncbi:ABC transporter related protein [Ancylobacter novellus DSM 506]|uniref:ABC transporter related protein n=1 Tax=Ancylobacter novellus (strain ATCC 8093 / DSM 506 / JCM 20403 / CCM 1077 / IAM 12100 / NBRC 12443 / NCIMB 10456) TaxID=639283 RepID=D7A801_ANCN5|nr:ribosome-associated ATPase/putative transporter RbbA [Ancylobacter novellus]ADH90459.1 ABC transporter related protein [Ancylobacter novellus DSM 506]